MLTDKEAQIIAVLINSMAPELSGIGIVQASNGLVGVNTVYAAMDRLRKKSYVDFREVSARTVGKRKYYAVTATGRQAYTRYIAPNYADRRPNK